MDSSSYNRQKSSTFDQIQNEEASFETKYSHRDECFSSFVLYHNLSKEDEKIVANSNHGITTVYFPNHNMKEINPEAINNLWMAGFLDRAIRDPEAMHRRRLRKMLSNIPDTVKVRSKVKKSEVIIQPDTSHDDLESKNRSVLPSDLSILSSLTPSLLSRADSRKARKQADGDDNSDCERSYPSGLFSTGSAKGTISSGNNALDDLSNIPVVTRKPSKRQQVSKLMLPYSTAIRDIELSKKKRQLLPSLTHPTGTMSSSSITTTPNAVSGLSTSFVSDELENYFDINRAEIEAAAKIQRCFRRTRVFIPIKRAMRSIQAAVKIQKMVRGITARIFVSRWIHSRRLIVTQFQARIRKLLSNKSTRQQFAIECNMAIKIQRITRGKLGRLRWLQVRATIAVIVIQRLWRGVSDRSLSDRKWLNRAVIPIQQLARKTIAMSKVAKSRRQSYDCALKIQRAFRSFHARKRLGESLYQREMNYRMDCVAVLTCEEEYAQDSLEKNAKKFLGKDLRGKVNESLDKYHGGLDAVYKKQNDLVELTRQVETLSPRAITQGWFQELSRNVYDLRNDLTKEKINCLMNLGLRVGETEQVLNYKVQEIERMAAVRNRITYSRDKEYEERAKSFYKRDLERRTKERVVAIADEKRRWQVKFCTPDGKPDKKRRPGKPWDASVFAGPERATYCGAAGVDLLAFSRKSDVLKPGTKESVDHTLSQLSLQAYLEQMQTYEQILNPISDIMTRALGQYPVHAETNPGNNSSCGRNQVYDNGNGAAVFGVEGQSMAASLAQIGVVPKLDSKMYKYKPESNETSTKPFMHNLDLHETVHDSARLSRIEARRNKRILNRRPAVIPWELLDQLDGERKKLENEMSYVEFNKKF